MKILTLALALALTACGGGSEIHTAEKPPVVCGAAPVFHWCDPQGVIVEIEHNSTNADHEAAGRAAMASDGLIYAVNRAGVVIPLGSPAAWSAICELRVGQFVVC